jgi:hypothetical protein
VRVPVGLNVWSRLVERTYPYLDKALDPFDSLWLPDHVQYGENRVAEGWTLLAFALARYPDKLCGHEVLCNSFRNPAHLAKMVATAQALSGGRVILGIGAGWNEEEYRAYGWPYLTARTRIAQLAEAIELIRTMWTQSPARYQGEHYRLADAHCEPRPDPTPEQVSSAEPRRPFGPPKPRREALDLGQVEPIAGEALVDDLDGGIRISLARLPLGECARRRGQSGGHRCGRQERPSGHGHGVALLGVRVWCRGTFTAPVSYPVISGGVNSAAMSSRLPRLFDVYLT